VKGVGPRGQGPLGEERKIRQLAEYDDENLCANNKNDA